MRYKAILFLIGMALIIMACENDSPLEPDYEQVVIQAYLYAGEPVDDIQITKTIPMGSETGSPEPINDAAVRLIKGGRTYDLTPAGGDSGYYEYSGTDLTVQTDDEFTLEVDYFDRTASGSTTVPPPPYNVTQSNDTIVIPINPANPSFVFDTTVYQISVSWQAEEQDADNYFFVAFECVDSRTDTIPKWPMQRGLPGRFVDMPQIQTYYPVIFEDFFFFGLHKLTVYSINQEYVDLYISRVQNSRELNEPLTNISNGLGVFSAFNSKSVFFTTVREDSVTAAP